MAKTFSMEVLLIGVLKGSTATRNRHIRQSIAIQTAITERFSLENPWAWKRKHMVWLVTHHLANRAASTRHYYFVTIRLIETRMGRCWHLQEVWEALR